MRTLGLAGLLCLVAFGGFSSAPTFGQDAGVDASVALPSNGEPTPADPRTAKIRSLIAGKLETSTEPQSLFEIDLHDEHAIQIQRAHILAFQATLSAEQSAPKPSAAGKGHAAEPVKDQSTASVELRAELDRIRNSDPTGWQARLALDRARLDFFSLEPAQREALLSEHAREQEAAKPRESAEERHAREAELERQRALAAARTARSEAQRAVSAELARLITLQTDIASARERWRSRRASLAIRRDAVLGWQRRVHKAMAGPPADADALYPSLRRALKDGRDELDRALDELETSDSDIPPLGPDALRDISQDASTDQVRERRAQVAREMGRARSEEVKLRDVRAASLLDEIDTLNRSRLALLAFLSPNQRDAITGFGAEGWDQARSELRQLLLILRYHLHVVAKWIGSIRSGGPAGFSIWRIVIVIVPWLVLVSAFVSGRRRSPQLLALAEHRLETIERQERRVTPSLLRRALRVQAGVHRPLEWLAFFAATMWLLPNAAQGLLEVQLLSSVIVWGLAGSLVVNTINAIAAESRRAFGRDDAAAAGRLRLRSLRLVGRVVVVFALILRLSARLVGEGTVFSWVLSMCWLVAVALFLILVRWWRDTVFVRVGRVRRKKPLQVWVLANRSGWKSFLAAMLGAVQLFVSGAVKAVRNWLAGWNFARHAHAYLFRRELDRLANDRPDLETHAIDSAAFDLLAPDGRYDTWIACSGDALLTRLKERLQAGRGGLIAVVGARGQGKSSLLHCLSDSCPTAVSVPCSGSTSLESICVAIGMRATGDTAHVAPALVLLDDAQTLLNPTIGGLATFDELFAFARAQSSTSLWVFAIDAVLWPFLRRARDASPLFDEVSVLKPWTEEQIGALLTERSARAGLSPAFDGLLDKLPASADEIDRQEALARKREGYIRMLWDHVRGNPGIALQVWRTSLVQVAQGDVRVRSLQVPDAATIELLPDSALFVLRAVLQLGPVSTAEVARATCLSPKEVHEVFRFGETHGYLTTSTGFTSITWRWLREVQRLLERRHLLVDP